MLKSDKTILIIDDDLGINKMLAFVFQAKGFKVQCAESGQRAMEILEEFAPEAIILDVSMPDMDGLEVCEKIKKDVNFKNIPIIFLSALPSDKYKERALSLGAFAYIEKPFLTKNLVESVNTAITAIN